jgi:hypothetical protein
MTETKREIRASNQIEFAGHLFCHSNFVIRISVRGRFSVPGSISPFGFSTNPAYHLPYAPPDGIA